MRNPFATMRGRLGPRRKGVEGLCVSSLLGVLRSHTWLIGEQDMALLLGRSSLPRYQQQRAHSLSFSFCSSTADGGSEDLADPRSPGLDPHLSHVSQGKHNKLQMFTCMVEPALISVLSVKAICEQFVVTSIAYYDAQM